MLFEHPPAVQEGLAFVRGTKEIHFEPDFAQLALSRGIYLQKRLDVWRVSW